MRTKNQEKEAYAIALLKINLPYHEIQQNLKKVFNSGVSNTTLQQLQNQIESTQDLLIKLAESQKEAALYKKLYFDILDTLKEKI